MSWCQGIVLLLLLNLFATIVNLCISSSRRR
jgi:hypothetical protein